MFYEKVKGKHCGINKIVLILKLFCLFRVCLSNTYCRTLNCGDCGICNWNTNLKKEYCDTSYLNQIFEPQSSPYCTLKNRCTSSTCLNGGTCKPKFGNYVCLCTNQYYGENCEKRIEEGEDYTDYASGLTVAYLPIDNVLKDNKILVSLDNFGDKFYLYFDNGVGDDNMYFLKDAFSKGITEKICNEVIGYKKACTKISNSEKSYYLIIKTAYPYLTKGRDIIKQRGEDEKDVKVIGKNVILQFVVYNKGSTTLDQKFPKIIDYRIYKNDNCIPTVQIRNCDFNLIRKTKRTIRSIVKPNKNCQDRTNILLKWNIYTYSDNFDEEKHVLPREEKLREFIIPQFSMDTGMYKVKLVATTTFVKDNSPHTYYNFASCTIEIKKLNLIAVIKGGISRSVYSKGNIILDGSKSSDPNEPSSNQNHLTYNWTCDKQEKLFCRNFASKKSQYKVTGPFSAGELYKFTLFVSAEGMDESSAFQHISIVGTKIMDLEIVCVKNCGNENPISNPKEIIYFRVEAEGDDITGSRDVQYSWTYTDSSGLEKSIDYIKEIGTPSNILIIKANSLTEGSTYYFNVQVKDSESKSSIMVIMATSPDGGNCVISPVSGIAATTLFTILCQDFTNAIDIAGLDYEFFEASTGVLLGFSRMGELNEVLLSQSNMNVRISNSYGMYVEKNIPVQVNPLATMSENIQNLINNVIKLVQYGDSAGSVRLISAISDAIMEMENKLEIIKILLNILSQGHINDFIDIKMYSLVLKKLVSQSNQGQSNGLDGDSCKVISAIMRNLSKKILGEIVNKYNAPTEITTQELQSVTRVLLETGDIVLSSRDPVMLNKSAGALQMFAAYKNYKMAASDIISTIENLGKSIGHTLLQSQPEVVIQSKTSTLWIKFDTPERLYNMTQIPLSGNSFVKISKTLMKALREKTDVIRLEFAALNENPYWWDYNEKNLESEVMSLRLFGQISDTIFRIHNLPEDIDIFLKLKNFKSQVISGSVTMPALDETDDEKDSAVSVHKLDAPESGGSGKVVIQFRNLKPNDTLKVLIMENIRPDYDFVNKKGSIITKDSSSYDALFSNKSPDVFLYIGLLPSSEVLPGVTIDYTFEMYSIQCQTRSGGEWNSKICKVGRFSTHDLIHCQCTHLSVFGGSILIAPNKIDPIKDIRLFLTVSDNPTVFILVVTLLLFYVSTLIWAYCRDRRNELQKIVIVLDDNYPGEKWGYLLTVFTGARLCAGTTANVGFEIFGKLATSRAHVFRSKKRKVLQKGSDDWFLIFTPKNLGELQTLHIWHDNSGPYPDWYCVKIIVHDLTFNKEYSFLVESWLSIGKYGKYVEAMLKPSLPKEITHFNRLFTTNAFYYFREVHLWLSIFYCHPRTCLTRTHRVSIATSLIMCSLLSSIMFYGVAAEEGVDEVSYSIKTREIIIAIESTLITTPVTFLIVFFFRKSRIVKQVKNQSGEEWLNKKDFITKMNESEADADYQLKKKGNCKKVCQGLSLFIQKVIIPKPLIPVQILNVPTTAVIQKPKFAIIGWILCQTCIWVSAFFIMLYGLKLGKVTSEIWMTATLIGIGQGIFISSPIKLCVYSFILALAFQKSYNVTTFDVNITDAMRLDLVGNKEFLTNLIKLRSQPAYHPLPRLTLIDMHKRKIPANLVWGPLMKLFTILMFTIILLMAADKMWSAQFYSNNIHIKTMLTRPMEPGSIGFEAALNITRFADYLLSTLIPAIYTSKWYNKSPLSSEAEKHSSNEWTNDANTRLLSIPRLRQIRIRPDACNIPDMMKNLNITCRSALSDTTEDTTDYDTKWRQRFNISKSSAWIYHPRSDASNYLYGVFGQLYHDGGYIAKFGLTHKETNVIVSQLIDNQWFDHLTRVIFLELSLYNINTKVISIATIMAEYHPSGAFSPSIQVVSLSSSEQLQTEVWFVILVFFQVLFVIQIIFKVTGMGLSQLVLSLWNILELCICLFCFVCLIMRIIHLVSVSHLLQTLQKNGKEEFVDISMITVYNHRMNFIFFVLILLSTVWVLRYSMLGYKIKTFFYTLKLSFHLMIWLILILLLFLLYVGSILCTIFNSPIFTNSSIILLYRMSYFGISTEENVLQQKNIKILYCFTCATGFVFFLILFTYYYRLGKYYKYDLTNFNIYSYIVKNKLKYLKPKSENKGFRLRGGSDKSDEQQNVSIFCQTKRRSSVNLHKTTLKLMISSVSRFLQNHKKLTLAHRNQKYKINGDVLFKDKDMCQQEVLSHYYKHTDTKKYNITEKLPYNTNSQDNSYYFNWMLFKLDCIIDKLDDIEGICDCEFEQFL